ncbi:MAG: hypothetical protein IRY91_17420 [Gemmatimonadaceae bacterium]|nr:hypothetical protein [Gemmatimonadaceae bacterium]
MDASDGQPSEPSNVYVTPIEAANSSVDVTGITFAHYSRPTLVEITVSGSYDMIWNVGSGTGTSAGTVDAGGWWSYL